jgi:integrase/recombinase XerD
MQSFKEYHAYLDNFLEMLLAEKSAAANTVSSYRRDLVDFLKFIAKQGVGLQDVDQNLLKKYISLLTASGVKASTLARKISCLRTFSKFLVEERIFVNNPMQQIELPKKGKSLPKALTQEEIANLLKTAEQDKSKEGIRLLAMLEILYATGMRISELVELPLAAMQRNLQDGSLLNYMIIRGKGNKERMVVLHQTAIAALLAYLSIRGNFLKHKHKSTYLFPSYDKAGNISHITRQRFGQLLKELAINSNISPARLSPHKIRHSFATHLLQNGANLRSVQTLLGHCDISSTQIYTKVYNEDNAKLVNTKHPLAK